MSATARAFSFFFLMLCREKLIEGSALLCTGEKSKYHELFYDIHKCFSGADLWTSDGYRTAEKELPKYFLNYVNYKV